MELLARLLIVLIAGAGAVFCQQSSVPKKLLPADEAIHDAELFGTRNALLAAARRGDMATIRRFTDPNLQVSVHGGARGLQVLEREWKRSGSPKRFLEELVTVLSLGGRFEDEQRRTFVAPYLYFGFSDATDMPGVWVVTKAKAPVYSRPDTSSRVLTELSYDVLDGRWKQFPDWAEVKLPAGRIGFMRSSDARNPLDTHAHFAKTAKGWRLVGFYAGGL